MLESMVFFKIGFIFVLRFFSLLRRLICLFKSKGLSVCGDGMIWFSY